MFRVVVLSGAVLIGPPSVGTMFHQYSCATGGALVNSFFSVASSSLAHFFSMAVRLSGVLFSVVLQLTCQSGHSQVSACSSTCVVHFSSVVMEAACSGGGGCSGSGGRGGVYWLMTARFSVQV